MIVTASEGGVAVALLDELQHEGVQRGRQVGRVGSELERTPACVRVTWSSRIWQVRLRGWAKSKRSRPATRVAVSTPSPFTSRRTWAHRRSCSMRTMGASLGGIGIRMRWAWRFRIDQTRKVRAR
ncbi:hypothetical protein DF268_01310 [Streptomyces sp. V2]|nr:hypothetical protein DF268_01310 [Streptomyces sp. V2]